MSQLDFTARALGEPEWWAGPGKTGVQLLESGAFAAEFVTEDTTKDIVEIRRIVFQMLGMDHLVFFIDVCCNYLKVDRTMLTPPVNVIILEEKCAEAMNATITEAIKAKQRIFTVANIRRLLWFALECGLDLGPMTRHVTPDEFRKQGISPFDLYGISLRGPNCVTVDSAEMLTRVRLQDQHLDGLVPRIVLAHTTLVTNPIFNDEYVKTHATSQLNSIDSGSAVWFEILDVLFDYHQQTLSEFGTIFITCACLRAAGGTNMSQLIYTNGEKQHRMLPWLLRKPDLNDGSLIVRFFRHFGTEIEQIFACSSICKDHPDWPHACVLLINLLIRRKGFIANVNRLLGMNVESQADIAAYVSANMRLSDVRAIDTGLMTMVVKHSTFDNKSSIDRVLAWMTSKVSDSGLNRAVCLFAYRLFQTRSADECAAIYVRLREVRSLHNNYSEIIYYLLNGKTLGSYNISLQCSHHLALDMLELKFNNNAIAHVLDAIHDRRRVFMPYARTINIIRELCKRRFRFDLLMSLINRHYHVHEVSPCAQRLIDQLITLDCYSREQRQIITDRLRHISLAEPTRRWWR